MNKFVPFMAFGEVRLVPKRIFVNGKYVPDFEWFQTSLWVERPEDYYALLNRDFQVPTLVVDRNDWLNREQCE